MTADILFGLDSIVKDSKIGVELSLVFDVVIVLRYYDDERNGTQEVHAMECLLLSAMALSGSKTFFVLMPSTRNLLIVYHWFAAMTTS